MEVTILDSKYESQYNEFLLENPKNLFFVSNEYRHILKEYLQCQDLYLLLISKDKIIGILPCFIKRNEKYGNVINSLPYYGSNGALIEYSNDDRVKDLLYSSFLKLCDSYMCKAYTIITSPFEADSEYYQKKSFDFTDSRRGLITHLPVYSDNIMQDLMMLYHQKQRNAIRKAQKLRIVVKIDNSSQMVEFLHRTHVANMMQVSGKSKEKRFFDIVIERLKPEHDFNIYVAELDGKPISALLVFYFNKTVEYFTPVIEHEYRSHQSLGLIILHSMADASQKGFENFNWGGTGGIMQDGVYKFKKSFGSLDYPYFYYTNVLDKSVLSLTKETILNEFEDFYVFPF